MSALIGFTATIKHAKDVSGTFDAISFVGAASKVALEISGGQLTLRVESNEVYEGTTEADRFIAGSREIANRIAAYLTKMGCEVGELNPTATRLPRRVGGHVITLGPMSVSVEPQAMDIDVTELERAITRPDREREWLLMVQFWMATSHDGLSRFTLLYNLLLQIAGDSQAGLDQLVRRFDPDCPFALSGDPTKAERGIKESLYTRLRNEIAHPKRTENGFAETTEEIRRILGQFSRTVRNIIDHEVASH